MRGTNGNEPTQWNATARALRVSWSVWFGIGEQNAEEKRCQHTDNAGGHHYGWITEASEQHTGRRRSECLTCERHQEIERRCTVAFRGSHGFHKQGELAGFTHILGHHIGAVS